MNFDNLNLAPLALLALAAPFLFWLGRKVWRWLEGS